MAANPWASEPYGAKMVGGRLEYVDLSLHSRGSRARGNRPDPWDAYKLYFEKQGYDTLQLVIIEGEYRELLEAERSPH